MSLYRQVSDETYLATPQGHNLFEIRPDIDEEGDYLDAAKCKVHGCFMSFIDELVTVGGVTYSYVRRVGRNFAWKWHRTHKFYGPNLTSTAQWTEADDSRGLYVLIHGLNNKPSQWHKQLDLLKGEVEKGYEVRAPFVLKKGKCTLDEAVASTFLMVKSYAEKNPGNRICLMGISNGGAIASEIDVRLRKEGIKLNLRVQSLMGLLCGTARMDMCCAPLMTGRTFALERGLNSERQVTLNRERREMPIPDGSNISYDVYAATGDLHIAPFTAALPHMPDEIPTSYFLQMRAGHITGPEKVAEHQIQRAISWMNSPSD